MASVVVGMAVSPNEMNSYYTDRTLRDN
jgi:hypothetical protein